MDGGKRVMLTLKGKELKNKIRVFSTFTGIGGFEIGIQNASVGRINTELVGYSEIDKYAVSVFERIFISG